MYFEKPLNWKAGSMTEIFNISKNREHEIIELLTDEIRQRETPLEALVFALAKARTVEEACAITSLLVAYEIEKKERRITEMLIGGI